MPRAVGDVNTQTDFGRAQDQNQRNHRQGYVFEAGETATIHWFVTLEIQPTRGVRKRRGIVIKHGKLNNRGIGRDFSEFRLHRRQQT